MRKEFNDQEEKTRGREMKILNTIIIILLTTFITPLFARSSASHTVTISIVYAHEISCQDKTQNTIQESQNGQDASTVIGWKGEKNQKITVSSQNQSLKIQTQNHLHKRRTIELLRDRATDLVNGHSGARGQMEIQYLDNTHNEQIQNVFYTLTDS